MLTLENITAGYDGALALRNVSLKVNSGEIVAIIGANGAGKSTTLLTISGLVLATSGRINFNGQSLIGLTPDRIVQLGLVHVPEGRRVFPDLTIEENLRVAAYLVRGRKLIQNTLIKVYEHFPRLKERRLQSAGTLSGGEQQMLAFGRAMMSQPKMLMLDEPSLGLAPRLIEDVMAADQMFSDSGITVLLVEQNANLALKIANRGYVMETGVVLMEGTGDELLSNEQVRASYLGSKLKDN
jgi:branched-chain amino acid transport system ATP-binding protein